MSAISFIALSLFLGGSLVLQASSIYSVHTLGALGAQASGLSALNSSGVAVGFYTDASGYQDPASFNGARTQLGTNGIAAGINDSGVIVGETFSGNTATVTTWSGTQQISLGITGHGKGINNAGEIAGSYQASATQSHAFRYASGKPTDLGTLGGGSWSSANAINNAGQIAGTSMLASGSFAAFFSNGSGLLNLGTLGGASSYGASISQSGYVAGVSQNVNGYLNAFLWTGVGLTNLGTLGGTASSGSGVNNAGSVVGSSLTAGNTATDGFLYRGGTMTDLNSLLPVGSGWTITDATAINDAGDILAIGQSGNQNWAVELTPAQNLQAGISPAAVPEPGAAALVAIGLIGLSRIGRKRPQRRIEH